MKLSFLIFLLLAAGLGAGRTAEPESRSSARPQSFDDVYRLVYFSVLEGLFEDGVAGEDVRQLLLQNDKRAFVHFVYSCPLCMPVVNALMAYGSRPPIYGLKLPPHQERERTMGPGLSAEMKSKLRSKSIPDRLEVVNALIQKWVARRLESMRLSDAEKEAWNARLQEGRKKGMLAMKMFEQDGVVDTFAPSYSGNDECAVCNGALGLGLKLDSHKTTVRRKQ